MMLHHVASIKTTCKHFATLFLEQLYLCLPMKLQHFHVPTSFAVFLIDVNKTRIVTKTHGGNAIIPNRQRTHEQCDCTTCALTTGFITMPTKPILILQGECDCVCTLGFVAFGAFLCPASSAVKPRQQSSLVSNQAFKRSNEILNLQTFLVVAKLSSGQLLKCMQFHGNFE